MNAEKEYNHGVALLRSGNFKDALTVFNGLIDLHPENADYWSERGVIYYHLNQKKQSLFDMDKAVELQPNRSYRYSSRAYIRGHFKMIDQAISDYRKAVELDPEDAIAYNNLGLLEEQIGYQDKAVEHFNIADELMKDAEQAAEPLNDSRESQQSVVETAENAEKRPSIWKELKTLATKEGRASFRRFIKSGFKKT